MKSKQFLLHANGKYETVTKEELNEKLKNEDIEEDDILIRTNSVRKLQSVSKKEFIKE